MKPESTFKNNKIETGSKINERIHAKPNDDGLRWDHTPQEMKDLSQAIIKKANSSLNEIIAFKGPRTFENTLLAIDNV